jgi:S1-C subfamily serine protease
VRQVGVIVLAMALAISGFLVLVGWPGGGASSAAQSSSLRDRLNLGVVAVDARIGSDRVRSSGVVIDSRAGIVLTSAYTVWGATSLRLTTGLGILYGRPVARAPCAGIALVEIQPRIPGLQALAPREGGAPPASELLSAVGRRGAHPDVGSNSLLTIPIRSTGTVPEATYQPGLPPLARPLRLDAAVVPESSGGPVVDADGRLVGIAMPTSGGDERGLVVPWSEIKARLDELTLDKHRIYVGWRDQYRCAPQLHAYAEREHPGYKAIDARINAPVPATRLPGTEQLNSQ